MLLQLFDLMILGLFVASLGAAFNHFLMPNMIFNFYAVWLEKIGSKSKFIRYWTMPLGLCPYCNTTWIAIVVYLHLYNLDLFIFLFIGIVYLFLKLILMIRN